MEKDKSIAVFNDYPKDKYNVLVPVKTITEISPLHKPSMNVVQISTDTKDGDVYVQKSGYKDKPAEYALTKKALGKLMAAANIQVVESGSVIPSSWQPYIEVAKQTGVAPDWGKISCRNDVAWKVVLSVPDLAGGARRVVATREFIVEDERNSMTEKQFKQAYPFRAAHAESKALNRALREALMLKSTYLKEELEKPFAVAMVSPNLADPELKQAMIARYASGEDVLFGGDPTVTSRCDTGGRDVPAIEDGAIEIEDEEFADRIKCNGCGGWLEEFDDPRTGHWGVERLAEWTRSAFGEALCKECALARSRNRRRAS